MTYSYKMISYFPDSLAELPKEKISFSNKTFL